MTSLVIAEPVNGRFLTEGLEVFKNDLIAQMAHNDTETMSN